MEESQQNIANENNLRSEIEGFFCIFLTIVSHSTKEANCLIG